MKRRLTVLGMAICFALTAAPADKTGSAGKDQKPAARKSKAQRRARQFATVGCVDEKDGRYVLVEDQTLNEIAELQAVSFEKEGFAKFLGHKVSVRGQMQSEREQPVLRVTSIEVVSGVCAPAQE